MFLKFKQRLFRKAILKANFESPLPSASKTLMNSLISLSRADTDITTTEVATDLAEATDSTETDLQDPRLLTKASNGAIKTPFGISERLTLVQG